MNIRQLIQEKLPVQYVYTYPTTRMYDTGVFSPNSITYTPEIHLYIHIPFCDQKCSFCGYLIAIETNQLKRDEYVDAVVAEILARKNDIQNHTVRSVNLGGGTPMLLSKKQIAKIMNTLLEVFPNLHATTREISIEATPESIEYDKVRFLKDVGFNRISVGIQTLDDREITSVKRHNSLPISLMAIETIKTVDIDNLCIDLMYGLPGQSMKTWEKGLTTIMQYIPETIELYKTVSIPKTKLFRSGQHLDRTDWQFKYDAYLLGKNMLEQYDYHQESHVRFIQPGKGFYLQQSGVFSDQSLIGFGVGARSYGKNMHTRNVYNSEKGKTAVGQYQEKVFSGKSPIQSGVLLTNHEQARRYAIHHLEVIDTAYVERAYGVNISEVLDESGLFKKSGSLYELPNEYWYFRDLLAYSLFSEVSLTREKNYYGDFLNIITHEK